MNAITIINAKIRDNFYPLIAKGIKQYEVRDQSFEHAQYIRYISASSGKQLGIWSLENTFQLHSSDRERLQQLADIPSEIVDELFPPQKKTILYVAKIGNKTTLEQIFKEQDTNGRER